MELPEDQQIKHKWHDVIKSQMNDDGNEDMNFLESLLFGEGEMTYNAMDVDTAAFVNEAINDLGEGKGERRFPQNFTISNLTAIAESREHSERSSDNENIQCANCGLLFTTTTFKSHVCTHDEFQEPIAVIPKDSELLKLTRNIELMMIKNVGDSKAMQKVKDKCKRCSRTFHTATGLQQHYEYHIGEIVDPAPSEDPSKLINLTLCVFCGQVFAKEEDAWDHLVSSHVHVHDDSGFIEDADATSNNSACSEHTAKKQRLNEDNNQTVSPKKKSRDCVSYLMNLSDNQQVTTSSDDDLRHSRATQEVISCHRHGSD